MPIGSARWLCALSVLGGLACLADTAAAHPGREDHSHTHAAAGDADENRVVVEARGDYRYIIANGLPDHEPGRFPNSGNPNAIREQSYRWRVPLHPVANETATPIRGPFGVALNGVPFDPGTAEFWKRNPQSGWREEAILPGDRGRLGMDRHHAHVQPNGAYHYHGLPTGLIQRLGGERQMVLVGYAADGFPIYGPYGYRDANDPASGFVELRPSYRLKQGRRPGGDLGPGGAYDGLYTQDYEYVEGLGDLDQCNGRFGITPEHPDGTYYYVLTADFPYVPRFWRGLPDDSFQRRGGGGPPQQGGPGGRPSDGERRRPPPPPRPDR